MGDAKDNQETHTFFKQFNKRNRTDLEEDSAASEGNLGVQPGNTNSDKPGRVTILPRPTSPTKQGLIPGDPMRFGISNHVLDTPLI